MGQCVSQKAVSAFQRPVAAHHHRKKVMHKNSHIKKNPGFDNSKKSTSNTKGVATSFGFRRRPITAPAIANNVTAAKRLAKQDIIDRNGNSGDTESLTSNAVPPGRTTPKLAPPRKEANATRINRFGFRQPNSNRLNKISDINSQLESRNNNGVAIEPLRYTIQTSQFPKPQVPVHILDTKTAKTLANNCKKVSSRMYVCENNSNSSKDGSFTEDSGVGSHTSSGNGEHDLQAVELTDSSPTLQKPRHYDVVLSGLNFDLRDLDETSEPFVPLPTLPSAFQHNTGLVQNRRFEYEKQLHRRKVSSSSEGFSDDYNCNFNKAPKKFLKTLNNRDASPYSSDQESWNYGGEAMAEDTSYSCSSSDDVSSTPAMVLQNLMNASLTNKTAPINEIRNVLLTIEDPKFAAVANNIDRNLLDDETSPTDSLVCSYSESEDLTKHCKIEKNGIEKSLSNSKDVNEKDSSSSPGTPTNASNSLSLSDGRDYFDDEIADQPALVFDDTLTTTEQPSENTSTLIDNTPKLKKFLGSPLLLRKKSLLNSVASVDTLSPCESIASDDLMMDFEQSQSSGLEDTLERIDTRQNSLMLDEDVTLKPQDTKLIDSVWAVCVGNGLNSIGSPKSTTRPSRLLRSRGSTSSSSKPDSPCSFDSHISSRNCHSLTRSPLRLARSSINSQSGYDSDDSVKLDQANHGSMIQDVVQIKTMLVKLRRILNEQAEEDYLKKSETLNPFDNQQTLRNGLFNGLGSENTSSLEEDANHRFELADLRRQVLFLQGQLEDREQSICLLHNKMEKLVLANETTKSAPASTVSSEISSVNASTQTERMRPISAGPSLSQMSPGDGSMGSLVSVNERKSRSSSSSSSSRKSNQPSLWRTPGQQPTLRKCYSANNTLSTNIPKRRNSRTRAPLTPV